MSTKAILGVGLAEEAGAGAGAVWAKTLMPVPKSEMDTSVAIIVCFVFIIICAVILPEGLSLASIFRLV